jgi:serpin B
LQPEEARTQINQWFESVKAGRITEVPSTATRWAAWRSKFDPRRTLDDTFYLHAFGHHVRASFISSGEPQYIACRSGYKVLRLPYALGRGHGGESRRCFSM